MNLSEHNPIRKWGIYIRFWIGNSINCTNPYFDSLTPNCLKSDKYGFKGHPEQYVVRRPGDQSLEWLAGSKTFNKLWRIEVRSLET